ncbi:uncharacterized protein [Branchiostoma lanceolatum]
MVKTSDSDDQPGPSSSSSSPTSPIDILRHGTMLLHTPKTLQATQAAQNQPLKQYFQSELYHHFSCNAREVIERVEAERRRRRDNELKKPLFKPTKFAKLPVWMPEFPACSRTRKPLISPHSSPPLLRRPLEQATRLADLNTEEVQVFVAKPFNTVFKGAYGYDDKCPILMTKPPADNDIQKLAVAMSKPKRYKKKNTGKDHLNSGLKSYEENQCEEAQETLNKTECTHPLDYASAGKMAPSDQNRETCPLDALEYMKLLPDRALAQIFLHLDTRSMGALKCSCQDFKWLIEVYELGMLDAKLASDPAGKASHC